MDSKTNKQRIPLDYLEEKTKQMMIVEFDKIKTIIPWDGMLDGAARNVVKMIKKEICDA